MAQFLFSDGSLRYFLLNFGQKVLEEYTEEPLDEEDLYVLEALLAWEMGLLYKAEGTKHKKIIQKEKE